MPDDQPAVAFPNLRCQQYRTCLVSNGGVPQGLMWSSREMPATERKACQIGEHFQTFPAATIRHASHVERRRLPIREVLKYAVLQYAVVRTFSATSDTASAAVRHECLADASRLYSVQSTVGSPRPFATDRFYDQRHCQTGSRPALGAACVGWFNLWIVAPPDGAASFRGSLLTMAHRIGRRLVQPHQFRARPW